MAKPSSKDKSPPRTDVRNKAMGGIYGDGPDVDLDLNNAVLLDGMEVCLVNTYLGVHDRLQRGVHESGTSLAMELRGRVNKRTDRASVLFIFDEDGAAAIISELLALASRIGPEFFERLHNRINELVEEGHVGQQTGS